MLTDERSSVFGAVFAAMGGALLSLVAPIQEFMIGIALIVMGDLYMAWRVASKSKVRKFPRLLGDAIKRTADYMATMIVAHVFEERFAPEIPITYIVGIAIARVEAQSMYQKAVRLHRLKLLRSLVDRFGDRLHGRGKGGSPTSDRD